MKKANTLDTPLINAEPPAATPLTKKMLRAGRAHLIPRDIRKLLGIFVGKQRKNQFRSKSMTRGVQISLAARQHPTRLAFIWESVRQGNALAKKRRQEYVQRRTNKWRALTESTLPRMFVEAMQAAGLGAEVGSGYRGEIES